MGFDTVLIANRGEIACRVIRGARASGLRTVAIYSDEDAAAPHVTAADHAVRIGPGPAAQSYLDGEKIIAAARESGAGAIHPGYGFLSENADFARAVAQTGLVFVGPSPEAIEAMGDKAAAKRTMVAAGVPCVPGYHGLDQGTARLIAEAEALGFPLMVKAAAGGGGKGMRLVPEPGDLPAAIERARSEAQRAFGNATLILERAVLRPRHVEIQVFADQKGNTVHLGERDCSVQRRHQKVIEEAPCPVLDEALRAEMGAAAVMAAQAVDYVGAGTVEFLLGEDGRFYFLEMNTRLQVEHPVTEMITGLDLVKMQFAVAQGEALALSQADLSLSGHAMEVRLYAEDPGRDFLPATGRVLYWQAPAGEGLRVDSGVQTGTEISSHYDPLLAKLIAWGPDRDTARERLIAGLRATCCLGVTTNAAFLEALLEDECFAGGAATTAFLGEHFGDGFAPVEPQAQIVALAAALILEGAALSAQAASLLPDTSLMGFASDGSLAVPLDLSFNGEPLDVTGSAAGAGRWRISGTDGLHDVDLVGMTANRVQARIDGARLDIAYAPDGAGGCFLQDGARALHVIRRRAGEPDNAMTGGGVVRAPMHGQVITLDVALNSQVQAGQLVAVLEAMKMQHRILADADGTVRELGVAPGDQVAAGAMIARIELSEENGT